MANIGMESKEISELRKEFDKVCQITKCRDCYMKDVAARYSEISPESNCDHIHASEKFILECNMAKDKAEAAKYTEKTFVRNYSSTMSF